MRSEPMNSAAIEGLAPVARTENLAIIFQELLTAIVRLRSDRQQVSGAEVFRSQILQAIKSGDQQARAQGYTEEDIRLAIFAVVAYLDETILNLHTPIFRDWVRKPLQEELFGRHVAGEIFFENLDQLLGRRDSEETADVLEVYYLCLLLGYLGRYSIASKADLRSLLGQAEDKIQRIRKMSAELSPHWRPVDKSDGRHADPWIRRLLYVAAGCAALSLTLLIVYKLILGSGVTGLQEIVSAAVN
ncbi:MAG: DotU family type IV/VI secretion system protein [Acidobacteriota bacterium]